MPSAFIASRSSRKRIPVTLTPEGGEAARTLIFFRNLLSFRLRFLVVYQEDSVVILMLLALTDGPLFMLDLTSKKHEAHELLLNLL
jgi:hypothetical protein